MRFRFLIDESGFPTEQDAVRIETAFELLLQGIEICREHGVGKLPTIWEREAGGRSLADWLFVRSPRIDRDVALALQVALARTPDLDEAVNCRALPAATLAGDKEGVGDSVSLAVCETRSGRATGCVSPSPSRSGRLPIESNGTETDIHFIHEREHLLEFFRDVPEVDDLDERAYFENASHAFPDLKFDRSHTRFSDFDEAYKTIRIKVTRHLAVLNDHARDIFSPGRGADKIQAGFAERGVTASGESGNTKQNRGAMRRRNVEYQGRSLACTWHTKLRPHLDRIYFNATSTDKVVVGIFYKHLP